MLPAPRDRSPPAATGRGVCDGGFTLIELLTVMSIIVILAGFGVAGIIGAKQRAAIARAKSELALLAQALEDFKRHYGDYPQTGAASQAAVVVTLPANGVSRGPGATTAQALLLNALIGVYGPSFNAAAPSRVNDFNTRLNGPTFVDVSKFTLEIPFSSSTLTTTNLLSTFAVAAGTPPTKAAQNNSFVDPWGNRYLYYYKNPSNVGAWKAPSYVLYSAGPDGKLGTSTTGSGTTDNGLAPASGLYSGTTQSAGFNADNIYADKLP
jgi:prepilin-type N-terminal cleavage/methylation domain-containing protein